MEKLLKVDVLLNNYLDQGKRVHKNSGKEHILL